MSHHEVEPTAPQEEPPTNKKQKLSIDTIDFNWIADLFPNKDAEKCSAWLKTLLDNEFEKVSDLLPLSDTDWDALGFPLAVKSKLKETVVASTVHSLPSSPTTAATTLLTPCPSTTEVRELTQVECIVLDISGSMRARSVIDQNPDNVRACKTREDVSKLLFHTLVDRLVSLELDHAVGLVAFGSEITPVGITTEYERFHDELGRLGANQNRTKLYDAIYQAGQHIEEYVAVQCAHQLLQPTKRIFVLTDGEDNASSRLPWQVAQYLQQGSFVLDCIPVGGPNTVLQCMTAATHGGVCLEAVSMEQALALFEREAVLHVGYRELLDAPPTVASASDLTKLSHLRASAVGPVQDLKSALSKVVHAPVLSTQQLNQKVEEAAAAATTTTAASTSGSAGRAVTGGAAMRRILKEYNSLMNDRLEGISAFVSADDVHSWKIVLAGPKDTPYEDGNFLLTVQFPSEYPFKPPKIKFVTPIYHCNISGDGNICVDILRNSWSPVHSIATACQCIRSLLEDPNPHDPMVAYLGSLMRDEPKTYENNVRDHVKKNASLSFVELAKAYNLCA